MRPSSSTSAFPVALLAISLLLLQTCPAFADEENAQEQQQKLDIDPSDVRDAIASLLRENASGESDTDAEGGDGYTEAAQEYLEHVQSVLGSVRSPTELYAREQLADLETLDSILAGLETAGARLTPSVGSRLVAQLVKGPARKLLLTTPLAGLEPGSFPTYAGSDLAARLNDAALQLRRCFEAASADGGGSLTDELRRRADDLPMGPTREYFDAVLDRILELDGQKVRFNVDYPDAGKSDATDESPLGEPRITAAAEEDGETISKEDSSTSEADADNGGKRLFDQVLGRRAAASVAAALASDGGRDAAAERIEELRKRRYQPSGMEVILETIEQCLKVD